MTKREHGILLRIRRLIVLLLYILTIVSAGAVKGQETETANYLNIFAEADPAKESIQIAPDPFGGAWEKLMPKTEENFSTILILFSDVVILKPIPIPLINYRCI